MEKHIIWSNTNLNLDDWRDDLLEEYPGSSEEELFELMVETNASYLDDEKLNLNINLPRNIICIADLGLWDGRRPGYKELGSNIQDCLFVGEDYATWYVDEAGDLRCDATHHDGTNHNLFRMYKESLNSVDIEIFQDKIVHGKCTREDIEAATERLGDEIAEVYGWELKEA